VATLNIRTVKGDEGAVIRFWTDTISESEAQKLSDLLAQTMEGFVNDPHQLADEIDTPKSNVALPNTEAAPQEPGTLERPAEIVTNPPQIVASEIQLRDIIAASVRETIEQLLKSGAITARDPQQVGQLTGFTPQEVVQPMMDYSQMTPTRASRPSRPKAFRTTSTATFASVASTARDQLRRVEQKLLSVWSQLLQISEDSIKKDDSFFQLGGDSIIAMQMVGMARDEDLDLTVANIFRHPTFSEMAVVIKSAEENDAAPAILDTKEEIEARESRIRAKQNALYQRYSLVEAANVDAFLQENICSKVKSFRGGITDVFPVTDFQALAVTGTLMESKWMLNYFYLEGTGSLDLRRIKSAISQVVNAFEILRTVFVPYGNRFFQVVLRKLDPGFEVHEADNLAEFTLALQQKDRDNGPRPGEPYLKFSIVKQRDSALHRIIMRISHAQYDGVCLPTILTALQTGYMGQKIPSAPSFSNYIRDAVQGTADHHYVYWKDFLKGSSMTEVVRRNNPNYRRGTDAPTTLKRILRINSLASENVTPATVIKAAWSLVLAQWSAQTDIVFGNVISGRNADVLGVENIVGPCVNLVPVRIQFQHRWSVLDLLQSIQTQQVAAMPYESLGFREIIKHCTDWPDWANFSTVCQHQNIQRETQIQLGRNDYTLGAVGSQEDFADLTVLSTPQENDDIEISLTYTSTSGITDSFASEMFEALCKTTMGFSVNPRAMLPSPTELSLVQRKTLDIAETILDLQLSKDALELSRDEQSLYTEILTTAWNEILSNQNDQPAMIDLNSSFYDLGGDIIGLAQVSSLLEEQNLRLRVEDLVDHPVMMDQLTLLAAQRRKTKELEIEEIQGEVIKEPSVRGSKKGIKKLLGKSVRFAMRKAPRM
jgi:aryl carrier-like protein